MHDGMHVEMERLESSREPEQITYLGFLPQQTTFTPQQPTRACQTEGAWWSLLEISIAASRADAASAGWIPARGKGCRMQSIRVAFQYVTIRYLVSCCSEEVKFSIWGRRPLHVGHQSVKSRGAAQLQFCQSFSTLPLCFYGPTLQTVSIELTAQE